MNLIEAQRRNIEAGTLERRLARIEESFEERRRESPCHSYPSGNSL